MMENAISAFKEKVMSLQDTPRANRLHIGIFGKVNSGKSTLLNALTNQDVALVSKQEGTTTDPVYKAMEIAGIGPVVWIDTAGFEDRSELGKLREEKTREAAKKSDIALLLVDEEDLQSELEWYDFFKKQATPVLLIVNEKEEGSVSLQKIQKRFPEEVVCVNALKKQNIEAIKNAILRLLPSDYEIDSITGDLCKEEDVVLLVMPQDIQAPKGRLILPQVQTIRDLLDKKCKVLCCTMDTYASTLSILKESPTLIICDSQVFKAVYEGKPQSSRLTSFSVLFAHYKGDITTFIEGANAISSLQANSRVLIAEACTHAPLSEDIGREKIPKLLRQRFGETMQIDIVSGNDFPPSLLGYDLIIHCGACMFHRKYVLHRIEEAKKAGVPMTNYGVCLAYLHGILHKIDVQK